MNDKFSIGGMNTVKSPVSPRRFSSYEGQAGGNGSARILKDGAEIGGYKVIKQLGAGGMGQVYLVKNIQMRKLYALKVLLPYLSKNREFIDRFKIEARVMADLEHPNIVKVHYVNEDKARGLYYLVMEFISGVDSCQLTVDGEENLPTFIRRSLGEGGTNNKQPATNPSDLEGLLKEKKKLPEDQVLKITRQLCSALSYAHTFNGKGVLHCDLKPSNILLDSEGNANISDFGLVKILGKELFHELILGGNTIPVKGAHDVSIGKMKTIVQTKDHRPQTTDHGSWIQGSEGTFIGTYEYMAPEQQEGGEATVQSDIYSLGLIIYRMLTGLKAKGRWDLPSELGLSKKWDDIVIGCLKQSPDNRFKSVKEITDSIGTEKSYIVSRFTKSLFLNSVSKNRNAVKYILSAIVLILVLYFGYLFIGRGSEQKAVTLKIKTESCIEKIVSLKNKITQASPTDASLIKFRENKILSSPLYTAFLNAKKKGDYLFKREKFGDALESYNSADASGKQIVKQLILSEPFIKAKYKLINEEDRCLNKLPAVNGGELWVSYIKDKKSARELENKTEYEKSMSAYKNAADSLQKYYAEYAAYLDMKKKVEQKFDDLNQKYKDFIIQKMRTAETKAGNALKSYDYQQAFSLYKKIDDELDPIHNKSQKEKIHKLNADRKIKEIAQEKENRSEALKNTREKLIKSLQLYNKKGTWISSKHAWIYNKTKYFKPPAIGLKRINASKIKYYYSTYLDVKYDNLYCVEFQACFKIHKRIIYYEDNTTKTEIEKNTEYFSENIDESTKPVIKYAEPDDAPKGYYLKLNGNTPRIDYDNELFFKSSDNADTVKNAIINYVDALNNYNKVK